MYNRISPEEARPIFCEEVFLSLLLVLVITSSNTFATKHHLSSRIGLKQKKVIRWVGTKKKGLSDLNSSHLVSDPIVALLPINQTDLHACHWASHNPHPHVSGNL